MKDKLILITGSTDGIGKQTAVELALMGAQIIVHGRNKERVNLSVQEVQKVSNNKNISGFTADFSSLKHLRSSLNELKSKLDKIDVLINNAGVYMSSRILSEDGYEMTFAVNHLAHFLLTNELFPQIQKSKNGRIINVSSMTHLSGVLDFNNLNAEKNFNPYGSYCLSKLANVLFSRELANRLDGTGITSNSLHPGVIGTKLLHAAFKARGDSVKKGAETSVHLASSPTVSTISGKYFVDKKIAAHHPIADDGAILKKFWEVSKNMI